MLERLTQKLREIELSGNIAVACSGGADSVALTLLAHEWALAGNANNITAITIDHGLRKESANEAKQVGVWLSQRNIHHVILTWEGDKKDSNIQASARNARYELMVNYCLESNIPNLLVAHNKEDQAENVLIRLIRGSGIDGLAAMNEVSDYKSIKIIRPLLGENKAQLKQYLQDKNQEWVEDPSNKNEKYLRVGVRKLIQKSADSDILTDRLYEAAQNIARSRDYIDYKLKEDFNRCVEINDQGYAIINAVEFKLLHKEAGYKILSKLIKNIGGNYYKPRFEKLKTLYDNVCEGKDSTLGGCEIFFSKKASEKNICYITREYSSITEAIEIKPGQKILWDKRFICLYDNSDYASLQISALGKSKINIPNNNLPKKILYGLPCFRNGDDVVAIPAIGYLADSKGEFVCSSISDNVY